MERPPEKATAIAVAMVAHPLADGKEAVDPPQRKMMGRAARYHVVRVARVLDQCCWAGSAWRFVNQVVERKRAHADGFSAAGSRCGNGARPGVVEPIDVRLSNMGRSAVA